MVKIYHNPRCGKSRAGLKAVQDAGIEPEIIKYLETTPNAGELKDILGMLSMKPIELVRVKESIWKDNFKGKDLSDDEIIVAMVENPKLIERPIVVKGGKAALGRPTENIINLLK
ncbi:MAG: arsenate reductase (glutaredoxin) [Bacteroidota bacterium]